MSGFETAKVQRVPLKVYRSERYLTIAAPLAGMEPEDMLVEITASGLLQVDGSVRGLLKDGKEVLLDEWSVGAYARDYVLPEPVNGAEAVATYGNGVLVVALPLASHLTPARLTLSRGERPAHGMSDNIAL